MNRICLYYRHLPQRDRWLPGDRIIRPFIRRIVAGKSRTRGPEKVFRNLCAGLDRLGIAYEVNLPFAHLREGDRVGVIGSVGRHALQGYDRPVPIVAGPCLMTHPTEWPTLCDDYPVAVYLQHSAWANEVYKPYFGDRCRIWPVGIDTEAWHPRRSTSKTVDFLIYEKILWDRTEQAPRWLGTLRRELTRRGLSFIELHYGAYDEREYKEALDACRAMIFLCEHESQGLAYLECLASDVPILAWDQGRWLDPLRLAAAKAEIPARSVPYFDQRCGLRFRSLDELPDALSRFLDLQRSGEFAPRAYVTESLTVEKCSARFLAFLEEAQTARPAFVDGRWRLAPTASPHAAVPTASA